MKIYGKIMFKIVGVIFGVLLVLLVLFYFFQGEILAYINKDKCQKGNYQACYEVGKYYRGQAYEGAPEEYHVLMKNARTYLKKACDGGISSSCSFYALMISYGYGGDQKEEKAVRFYEKACDAEDGIVGCRAASLLLFNRQKFEKAINYAIKICDFSETSCYLLGSFYLRSGQITKAERYFSIKEVAIDLTKKQEYIFNAELLLFKGRKEALDLYRDFFGNEEVWREEFRRQTEMVPQSPWQEAFIEKAKAKLNNSAKRDFIRKSEILDEVVRLKEIAEHYPEQEKLVKKAIEMLNSYADQKDYEEDIIYARSWCDEMNEPFYCMQLGWFLILEKRLTDADEALKKTKLLIPESYSPHIRAYWHLVQGEKDKAFSLYKRFLNQYKKGKNPARLDNPARLQENIEFEFSLLAKAYPDKKDMLETIRDKLLEKI